MAQRENKSLNYILFFSMVAALVTMGAGCSNATDTAQTPTPSPTPVVQTPAPEPTPVVETPTPSATPVTAAPAPAPAPTPVAAATVYKDGTYNAAGNYMSPGGPEEIKVQLTVKNDVVTAATVTPEATIGKSAFMQKAFADNYKPLVIGKKLSSLSLGKVSGSSLTPLGFNDAVAKIQVEAKI